MKRKFFVLLVSLISTCMYAYYPAYVAKENGDGPYPHAVMDIAHDDASIYVALLDGRLVAIDKKTGEKRILDVKASNQSYIPWFICAHDGKLWIGTAEGKILYYSNGGFHQSGIKLSWEYSYQGIPLGVENITFDPQGNMYVSCTHGVGFKVDPKNNVERFTIRSKNFSLFSGHICVDRDGALWVANYGLFTYDYGLVRYTRDKGTVYYFKEHPDVPHGGGNVTAMAKDDEGSIWYNANSKLVKLANGEMSECYDCPYICYDMQFDAQQRLWMADQHGPLRMMEGGAFTSYPCPIESRRWMCMDIDGDDIYIGTDDALLIFNEGEYTKISLEPSWQQAPTSISSVTLDVHAPLYDMQGRRLSQRPEHGAYIRDGRKVVIK